jgi:phospholipase C
VHPRPGPAALFSLILLGVASGAFAGIPLPAMQRGHGVPAQTGRGHRATGSSPLSHIVIVIQENRTVDNLFNGFCVNASICANTVTVDPVTGTQLQPASMAAPFDPSHAHSEFVSQFDYGKMDGFVNTHLGCEHSSCPYTDFVYVPATETAIYREMATVDGEFSDMTFETDQGPSLPAHLYAIAGQSGGYDKNHDAIDGGTGNCRSTAKTAMELDMTTPFPGKGVPRAVPCKNFKTIFDLLTKHGHTWRYYSDNVDGFKSPTQIIKHLYNSPNFIVPSTQFLTDVGNGTLADVTFVMPWGHGVSDHPGLVHDPTAGPEWVASVTNAIGETPFWNNTAIVIWWDDWGGLYDHVAPMPPNGSPPWMGNPDPLEYGFRVPLMVVSPYARVGTIDHTPRSFVSALRLIEETFGLPTLGTEDQFEPDGLDSMLNFQQEPIPYTPLGGSAARPFLHLR